MGIELHGFLLMAVMLIWAFITAVRRAPAWSPRLRAFRALLPRSLRFAQTRGAPQPTECASTHFFRSAWRNLKSMNIALLALDLDDTLLREDRSISPGNRAALQAAADKGVRIVLASGRNIHSMLTYARELGLDRPGEYLICSNGAEILETSTQDLLMRKTLSPGLCRRLVDAIEAEGFPWQVYEDGMIHVSHAGPWAELDTVLTGQPNQLIQDKEAFLARGQLKFVVPGEPERISSLMARLGEQFSKEAEIFTSKPYFLEILPAGVNKGSALQALAADLSLDMARVMAVGDAMNDLAMIQIAGWGCAPANALPEVRAAARVVSGRTNEEDAVAELIEKLVLSGEKEGHLL